MKHKDLILLAGASILLYRFADFGEKNAIGGIENMSGLFDLSNKSESNKKVVVELGVLHNLKLLKF